ncbi:hypothetical protein CGCA056_v002807 [Colletotrichum aenigma]|uniref:uncharacterized protein n=1 Tax=Colletotrichum aenigma TaxID=1215731 RepID=UPI0018725F36|nr:uncharacterized protein CGCA056_v002807 [Colletotrichum aenigma]KAF5525579.1 hypothetical protein CGCA056_v002807 [Colletotrichum aenigma]
MPPKKNKGYTQSLVRTCAVFVHDFSGPILASGIKLGNDIKIKAKIRVETTQGHEPSITLFLYFPEGIDNEDRGHGARFVYSQADGVYRPSAELRIGIRFRREKWTQTFEAASPELLGRFPGLKGGGGQTVITFSSDEDDKDKVCVEGMGMPYINKSEPELEKFVNENCPLIGGVAFIDFVRSNTFHVLVELQPHSAKFYFSLEQLPPPFDHPYGTLHTFNPERSALSMASNPRNHAYNVSHSFNDDNAMLTVTTQSLMQDSLYLWKQARCIAETKLRAYFIPVPDRDDKYYAILTLPKEFVDKYRPAWQRLIDRRTCQVSLARWEFPDSKVPSGFWKSHFITYTGGIQALASHPTGESDVVLVTSRPPPEEAERKIIAINSLWESDTDSAHLARLTMRGQGYAEWMMAMRPPVPAPAAGDQGANEVTEPTVSATINKSVLPLRPVPKKSYLPEDRQRWPVFFREVLLGLAIINAGPGYGKTTEMAKNILAMEYSFGRVFCTAPSNVAVTNLAVRTYRITMAVCDRHNDNLPDETPRALYRMILRGYKRKDEIAAFSSLLKDPKLGDAAAPRKFGGISHWRLDLSLAFWVLVLLRSPSVRELHDDDKTELHELQHEVDARGDWTSLRDMATGRISWDAYAGNSGCPPDHMKTVQIIMDRLVAMAEVLATTPAMIVNTNEVYKDWRSDAKAVAIDEAANMDRGDLITAWGNEMLPLLCGGDPEQLPSFVLTDQSSLDASGHVNNQFSHDGRVSAQGFFMASGHSVYRLHRQLRIGNGLFDIIGKVIYPDIPVRYGPDCNINLPQFEIGHRLEAYFRERFPDLLAHAKDKFAPIFVHCNDTLVYVNPVTGSKRSPDQVHTALSFAADFITKNSVDPSKLAILKPAAEITMAMGNQTMAYQPAGRLRFDDQYPSRPRRQLVWVRHPTPKKMQTKKHLTDMIDPETGEHKAWTDNTLPGQVEISEWDIGKPDADIYHKAIQVMSLGYYIPKAHKPEQNNFTSDNATQRTLAGSCFRVGLPLASGAPTTSSSKAAKEKKGSRHRTYNLVLVGTGVDGAPPVGYNVPGGRKQIFFHPEWLEGVNLNNAPDTVADQAIQNAWDVGYAALTAKMPRAIDDNLTKETGDKGSGHRRKSAAYVSSDDTDDSGEDTDDSDDGSDDSGRHQRTETAVNNGDSTGNSGEPFATILRTDENEAPRQLENMMANINSAEIQKEKTAAAARVAQWLTLMGDSTSNPLYQRYKPIMDLTRAETIISMSQAESALSQIRTVWPRTFEHPKAATLDAKFIQKLSFILCSPENEVFIDHNELGKVLCVLVEMLPTGDMPTSEDVQRAQDLLRRLYLNNRPPGSTRLSSNSKLHANNDNSKINDAFGAHVDEEEDIYSP